MFVPYIFFEAAILASSCSIDAFVASFAYGSNKVKIPMLSIQIINLICSGILGLSFVIGGIIMDYLPQWLITAACFSILFIMGFVKLLSSIFQYIINKKANCKNGGESNV